MLDLLVIERNPFYSNVLSSLLNYYGHRIQKCFHPEYLDELVKGLSVQALVVNFYDDNDELIAALNKLSPFPFGVIVLGYFFEPELEKQPFYIDVFAYLVKPRGILFLRQVLEQYEHFLLKQSPAHQPTILHQGATQVVHGNQSYRQSLTS